MLINFYLHHNYSSFFFSPVAGQVGSLATVAKQSPPFYMIYTDLILTLYFMLTFYSNLSKPNHLLNHQNNYVIPQEMPFCSIKVELSQFSGQQGDTSILSCPVLILDKCFCFMN